MQTNIHHTVTPDKPIEDFTLWYQYLSSIQGENAEIRQYKREIEASFTMLHNSITNGNLKRQ